MTFLEEYSGHVATLDSQRAKLSASNRELKRRLCFLRTTEVSRETIEALEQVMISARADEDDLVRCVHEARTHILELSQ